MKISLPHLRALISALAFLAIGPVVLAQGQDVSPAPQTPAIEQPTGPALASLRPALIRVDAAVVGVNIPHWRASKDLRASTLADVASIQQDLNTTLPPLLDQAIASETSLAPSFAVYRNIDALYDVLLRISSLANLAGPSNDAGSLQDALAGLESSRGQLGNALLQSVMARDVELAHLRARPTVAKPAPAVTRKIVVDDGPEKTVKHHRKRPAGSSSPVQ